VELQIAQQARGVRIIDGEQAQERRYVLNQLIAIAETYHFEEIILPSIEPVGIYVNKAGDEILRQMYVFPDKKDRPLCLRPEATATIQEVAKHFWRGKKEVRRWYFEKCWRYERPQRGRYREFWQFGVEIINPQTEYVKEFLIDVAREMVQVRTHDLLVNYAVKRGLDYYVEDGFEISCEQLGAQKQVCGGGAYEHGIGFAIGFDRLMLCK
jgi:histidyl-tRNA synthetase